MLDKMLKEAYSKNIYPSDELMRKTKMRVRKVGVIDHVIAISILLSIVEMAALGYFVLFDIHNLLIKIAVCSAVLTFFNIIILVIFLCKEKLIDSLRKLEEY